jgi:hypothetical protein
VSKFVGFIVGAIEIGVGILTGNVALVVTGVLTITAQAITDLTMPKGAKSRNALETELQLGEIPRRVIFGKTATAGSLVDAGDYGGKYGTDHEVVIFALADHECDSLVEFYVNDLLITYIGDGAYTEIDPTADSPHLWVYFRSGTETQDLPSVVSDNLPGWTSSDNGAGICYVVVDYRADKPDNKKLAFPGGRPSFLWVVKGKKCYDPRLDDTVTGGSGTHRWADPSTWEWSENPIVCAYNWRRGIYACDRVDQPSMLLVGRGLTETEAPPAYIAADANLCDEVMDDSLPRYTIGGVIAADEKYIDVEEKFAAACGGIIIQPEGTVQIEPAQARTPSFTFTDDDILVGSTVEYNQGVLSQAASDWINTTIPQFVSPAQKWQDHAAPIRRVEADVLADGGSREEQIQLQLVTNERQASDVGEIHRKLGRLWGRGSVTLPALFADVEEGDWGTWNSARLGISMTVRVEGYGLDLKWQNALNLREINSSVYDGVLGSGSSTGTATDWDQTTPPIDIGSPDSGNWSLAAVLLTDTNGNKAPALEITGDTTDDEAVEGVEFAYWKSDGVIDPVANPDDPAWIVEGLHAPSTTKVDISGLEGGASYYASVRYKVSGEYGDRLVLGPVTAGSTDVSGQVNGLVTTATDALAWKQPVRAKTTAALAANTYSNGTSGVGATLTGNANGALAAVDGVTLAANNRVLVDHEATGSHNGIYKVTQVGDASHPYILTRTTDADSGAELVNATVKISEGTTFADQEWQCTTNATITVGTTALVWATASASNSVAVQDEGSAQGSAGTLNFTGAGVSASVSGGVGTINIPGGGTGPVSASIRSSSIQSSSGAGFTVTLPAGAAAGDLVLLIMGSGFGFFNGVEAGWTLINHSSGSNFLGDIAFKVLTTTDINKGTFGVTQSGSFNAVICAICFIGAPTIKDISTTRNGTGSGTRSVTIASTFTATDFAVYFGMNRNASADSLNLGSAVQSINAASASGVVTAGTTGGTSLTLTATYGTTTGTTGDYQGIIVLSG